MNSIQELLQPSQLQKDYLEYQIIDPRIFGQQINRLLKTDEIRREYHRSALGFEAVRRWECLERTGFNCYPRPAETLEGESFLYPEQVDSCDWRWDRGPGRPAFYLRFTCHGSCHQRALGDLALARRLMPDFDWIVVSTEKHTAVICPEQKLIWDPSYFALEVSAQSALHTMFGKDLDETDYEIYEEEYAFSRQTIELMHIFDLVDGYAEDKRLEICKGLGEHLTELRAEDNVSSTDHELMAA